VKLVHWPLTSGLLHLVERGWDWAGLQPAQSPSRCTKCNSPPINGQCTNHRVYNGPLLCGVNVAIKGLRESDYIAQATAGGGVLFLIACVCNFVMVFALYFYTYNNRKTS